MKIASIFLALLIRNSSGLSAAKQKENLKDGVVLTNNLRRRLAYGFNCGCPTTCTEQILSNFAGQYMCGARIDWLMGQGYLEEAACELVAGEEFPNECNGCDPNTCDQATAVPTATPTPLPTPLPTTSSSICGCESCTPDVLNSLACDGSGCFSCEGRLNWLMTSMEGPKLPEYDACVRLAHDEFPDGPCGPACDPLMCNPATPTATPTLIPSFSPSHIPTSAPTHKPTLNPTVSPTAFSSEKPTSQPNPSSPSPCGCVSCTQDILNTLAGDYSCGDRISYLQSPEGGSLSENQACIKVSGEEFPGICGPACDPLVCNPVYVPDPDPANLVWFDEFEAGGSPDANKWSYDIGGSGWGNNEQQYYTSRSENAFISNGILNIRAVRETYQGKEYTSARMVTRYLGDWKYGRVLVRARLSKCTGLGTWPAIWMLPTDWVYGGWPASGEIDIMEHVGYDTGRIHGTVHTEAFNHMIGTQVGKSILTDVSDWHVYEIIWNFDKIEFVMDGVKYHEFSPTPMTYKEWPFDQRFYLIMNVAVGGTWGGSQGVDSDAFGGDGQVMEVDWVRVYSS